MRFTEALAFAWSVIGLLAIAIWLLQPKRSEKQ